MCRPCCREVPVGDGRMFYGDVWRRFYLSDDVVRPVDVIEAIPRPLIDAALRVLADGKARTADEILAEGLSLGLIPAQTTRKHLYTSLSQYVERSIGAGKRPEIVLDAEHRFRLNRAPDDWPDLDTTGLPPLSAPSSSPVRVAAAAGLGAAAAGSDPGLFEQAVCAAFAALGFAATHVGGENAPDGYADAPLGSLGYRVMIECKLEAGASVARSAAVAEAAKFKDAYAGDACVLVAPSFDGESTFASELLTHGVSAWSVDDLVACLRAGCDCADLRDAFGRGMAGDIVGDLLWSRSHGAAKRLRVVASLIVEEARRLQRVALATGGRVEAPHFNVDVAMAAVDERLAAAGSASACTREEVQAAFDWLKSPLVGAALDAGDGAIVARP